MQAQSDWYAYLSSTRLPTSADRVLQARGRPLALSRHVLLACFELAGPLGLKPLQEQLVVGERIEVFLRQNGGSVSPDARSKRRRATRRRAGGNYIMAMLPWRHVVLLRGRETDSFTASAPGGG